MQRGFQRNPRTNMRGFPRRASGQRIDPIWPSSFSEDLRALLRQEKSPSYPYHAFFGATQGTVASWHKAVPGSTDYPPARPARRCKAYGRPLRPRNGRRGLVKDWRYILLDAIQHDQKSEVQPQDPPRGLPRGVRRFRTVHPLQRLPAAQRDPRGPRKLPAGNG